MPRITRVRKPLRTETRPLRRRRRREHRVPVRARTGPGAQRVRRDQGFRQPPDTPPAGGTGPEGHPRLGGGARHHVPGRVRVRPAGVAAGLRRARGLVDGPRRGPGQGAGADLRDALPAGYSFCRRRNAGTFSSSPKATADSRGSRPRSRGSLLRAGASSLRGIVSLRGRDSLRCGAS